MWNNQTGGTNRFLMRRADWSSMSPAYWLLPDKGSRQVCSICLRRTKVISSFVHAPESG